MKTQIYWLCKVKSMLISVKVRTHENEDKE